jgi:hypothetical protein
MQMFLDFRTVSGCDSGQPHALRAGVKSSPFRVAEWGVHPLHLNGEHRNIIIYVLIRVYRYLSAANHVSISQPDALCLIGGLEKWIYYSNSLKILSVLEILAQKIPAVEQTGGCYDQ